MRPRAASRPRSTPLPQGTVATQDLAAYPGGKAFLVAYQAKYGVSSPDPYAIYGYAVMQRALNTIKSLGAQGSNSKSAVLNALFAIKAHPSVLGTFGFSSSGDTTLKSYGLCKVGSNGEPVFFQTLTPPGTVAGPLPPNGQAGLVYAGNPGTASLSHANSTAAVAQYDVACF